MGGYKVMFFFNIPQHGDLHLDKILFCISNWNLSLFRFTATINEIATLNETMIK